MSKIAYRYRTPIPLNFWKMGILDPSAKIYKNRLAFLTWAFSKCRYDSFAFYCGRKEAALESGLTEDEWRTQEEFFIVQGILEKSPNEKKNRPSFYEWKMERLVEDKIIDLEKVPNQPQKSKENIPNQIQSQTIENKGLNDETPNHDPQPNEKTPNQIPENHPTVLRVEIEKSPQPTPNQIPTFNKQIKQESVCLKETKENKEKPSPQGLFLSHKEKDIFLAAKRKEELETLEAFIQMRDIKDVTKPTLVRWHNTFGYEETLQSMLMMLSSKIKKTQGGWIQKSLTLGWARKEGFTKRNREFARSIKEQKKLPYLKITQSYCKDMRNDKDYYYHIDPLEFETQLRKCL